LPAAAQNKVWRLGLLNAGAQAQPVEQSGTWKLTVNQGAAARVGLAVPPSVLTRADEVIE
jgi:ABC-type uncharacterized transport system substrate-binding protein